MELRNKELQEHIKNNVSHGAFNGPSKSYLRQKEKQELDAIRQAYNTTNRFEYYSVEQRN